MPDMNIFDFMITDLGEVMLILYARDTPPHENPGVILDPENHIIEFFRTDTEAMTLEEVSDDVFKNLENEDTLLVCEINPDDSENPEEAEIVYAYNAEIVRDFEIKAEDINDENSQQSQPDGPQYPSSY
ncbi:MAG: hypothetical protein J6N49_00875 [Alphaproteobacteria bacterium]|nr:hypothetical protein [Alphaproteobacteria bacterium]